MFPSPNELYPLTIDLKRTCFLKNVITRPNIIVGDYSYYDDNENNVYNFEKNVLYHFDFLNDKLIIGKFCQIASGVQFLMNGMFHIQDAFSTYPFAIFSSECKEKYPKNIKFPFKGDTVLGNDVWIGVNATIMPGIKIADGAIIGANSLVTKDIGPYEIWGGNPAKLIRKKFGDDIISILLKLEWWNWDINKIMENVKILISNDIEGLKKLLNT